MTARLFTLDPLDGFRPKTFAGHRDAVLGAYFSSDCKTVRVQLGAPFTASNRSIDLHSE
jgi:periodic tryptophan protein 2